MRLTLEKLWNEYFAEECAVINSKAGKAIMERTVKMYEAANELLTKQQSEAVEKYIEAVYEAQGFFIKKAFFSGCEFATSFLLEAGNFIKE